MIVDSVLLCIIVALGVALVQARHQRATLRAVRLDQAEFASLVRGHVVWGRTRGGEMVTILLADIGFDQMQAALDTARRGDGR